MTQRKPSARQVKARSRRRPVPVEIQAELFSWLELAAQRERRTVNEIVEHALQAYRSEAEVIDTVLHLGKRSSSARGPRRQTPRRG